MALMDESAWRGKIFTGGWTTGGGGDTAVMEPATGQEIGRGGLAPPGAGARGGAAAGEMEPWGIREMGKIPPAMQFEIHVATEEIFEAATLPSRPYGEMLPSEQPRLSYSERVPVGVVGVIAPFNFPQILAIRSVAPALALGNAVILKPDPLTAVSGGVVLARVFQEAGLPEGLLHVLPGGADAGEAVVAA